jgi:hypothetical protein
MKFLEKYWWIVLGVVALIVLANVTQGAAQFSTDENGNVVSDPQGAVSGLFNGQDSFWQAIGAAALLAFLV